MASLSSRRGPVLWLPVLMLGGCTATFQTTSIQPLGPHGIPRVKSAS
jgi:hypothetical protein